MRHFLYILFAMLLPLSAAAQSFSDFLLKVQGAPVQRQQYLVDSFLTQVSSYPLLEEDSLVHMLYSGSASKVLFTGDANRWSDTHSPLTHLAGTTLWYRSERFESDARLDYRYIVDGKWILDPKNPLTAPGESGPNSELRMPAYDPPDEIVYDASAPRGTMIDTSFSSPVLNNTRSARIYLPPGYERTQSEYPLLLVHDGLDYLSLAQTTTIIDNLIHAQRIPPVIAVFLPPVNRIEEYTGAAMEAYAAFVVAAVLDAVDSRYRTRRDARARAVIGSSDGGHAALYLAMRYPSQFGNVGAQSSNITSVIVDGFSSGPVLPVRVYMDLGTYDIEILIPRVRNFIPTLQNRGYDHMFQEFHEGHSWGNWRAHVDDMLEFFFSDLVAVADPASVPDRGFHLHAPRPNPAHGSTTVEVELSRPREARLTLFDCNGRMLGVLWQGLAPAGTQLLPLELPSLRPGVYYISLESERQRTSRRLLIF